MWEIAAMPKEIVFDHPHRRAHFEMFSGMDQPHFTVCAPVTIGRLLAYVRERGVRFTPALVWLIGDTANAIPQFRQRIRNGRVIEHDAIGSAS